MTPGDYCPHCGQNQGLDKKGRCFHCHKNPAEPVRDPNQPSALGRWWFRFTNRAFRAACADGTGHLVEARVLGSSDSAVGNQLQSVVRLEESSRQEGGEAWDRFEREKRSHLCEVRCRSCKHLFTLWVSQIPMGTARGYIVGWSLPWCVVHLPGSGRADRLKCPHCGKEEAPRLRILDWSRFRGQCLL